jgi:hypothetical protein
VKVSPEEHSTPKVAQISPAPSASTSSISSECMRTSRGNLTFLPVRVLMMTPPFLSVP